MTTLVTKHFARHETVIVDALREQQNEGASHGVARSTSRTCSRERRFSSTVNPQKPKRSCERSPTALRLVTPDGPIQRVRPDPTSPTRFNESDRASTGSNPQRPRSVDHDPTRPTPHRRRSRERAKRTVSQHKSPANPWLRSSDAHQKDSEASDSSTAPSPNHLLPHGNCLPGPTRRLRQRQRNRLAHSRNTSPANRFQLRRRLQHVGIVAGHERRKGITDRLASLVSA